jgi:hypothetical protein
MSDTVAIALIIAATLAIALLIFRRRLTQLWFRYKDLEAQIAAEPTRQLTSSPEGVLVSSNKQLGANNKIEIIDTKGEVSHNQQKGTYNELQVKKNAR